MMRNRQFEALYRANVAAVTAYFARRSAEPQTVADLTADTFVQAIMSFATFDPRKGMPRAWVFGIARRSTPRTAKHTASSGPRWSGWRPAGNSPPTRPGSQRPDRCEPAGRALVTGLTTLAAADQAVVELVDLAGLRPGEAAQVLGIAPGTLRMRPMRARARLRKAASPDLAHGTDPASEPEVKA